MMGLRGRGGGWGLGGWLVSRLSGRWCGLRGGLLMVRGVRWWLLVLLLVLVSCGRWLRRLRLGMLRGLRGLGFGYAGGAGVLGQYGVVVAQIGQEARVLRHREREARQIMVAARQALELASAGLDEAVRCSAQQRVDAAGEQLRRVGVAWRQLSERREAADTTCVRLLTAPGVLGAFSNLLTTTNTNTSTGAGVGVRTGTGAGTLAGTLAGTGAGVLVSVGRMSAFDHLVLQRVRPDLLTDLARCPP